jgi:hypothetical protein
MGEYDGTQEREREVLEGDATKTSAADMTQTQTSNFHPVHHLMCGLARLSQTDYSDVIAVVACGLRLTLDTGLTDGVASMDEHAQSPRG